MSKRCTGTAPEATLRGHCRWNRRVRWRGISGEPHCRHGAVWPGHRAPTSTEWRTSTARAECRARSLCRRWPIPRCVELLRTARLPHHRVQFRADSTPRRVRADRAARGSYRRASDRCERASYGTIVVAQGFAEFGPLPDNIFRAFRRHCRKASTSWRASDGDPAGGGMACIMREAGIVALFGTATLPEFRRRGVQTALIHRRLWEAAQPGCEYAVVSTMPGQRLAAQHGAPRLSRGLHQAGHGAKLAGD